MTTKRDGDDENVNIESIGYGKPPVRTRFKPGQSGNPNGRKKRAKKVEGVPGAVVEALNRRISARQGDKIRRITAKEGIAHGLVNEAMKGRPAAIREVRSLVQEAEADSGATLADELSDQDFEILERYVHRRLAEREASK